MKERKYTILLYGDPTRQFEFEQMLQRQQEAVGVSAENFQVLYNLEPEQIVHYAESSMLCGIYFSAVGEAKDSRVHAAAEEMRVRGLPFFPVATSIETMGVERSDGNMGVFNASEYQLDDTRLPHQLIVDMFHALNITSSRRKVFISYKRTESQVVADQLRDELILRGYQVFLDWISIEKGRDFQKHSINELNHSDIIIFLQTRNVFTSDWVKDEIISAELRGVSLFRLVFHEDDYKLSSIIADRYHVVSSCGKCRLSDRELNRICSRIESFRIASMASRRNMLLEEWQHEYEKPESSSKSILSDMVIARLSDKDVHMICPYFPDVNIIHEFEKKEKNKKKSIYCSLLGYSQEYCDYIKWVCRKTGIGLIQPGSKQGVKNSCSTVFLSASVPNRKLDCYEVDVPAVSAAVIAMIRMLSPHHRIVFGGHPEINPFVLKTAKTLKTLKNVTIYQSEYFEKSQFEDSSQLQSIKYTPVQYGENKKPDRNKSLEVMRQSMIREDIKAAVFIGGMEGVEKEYGLVAENREINRFILGMTGGAAKILASRYSTDDQLEESAKHRRDYIKLFGEINDRLLSAKS